MARMRMPRDWDEPEDASLSRPGPASQDKAAPDNPNVRTIPRYATFGKFDRRGPTCQRFGLGFAGANRSRAAAALPTFSLRAWREIFETE
jgi:hypothetical protein